jgi:hypothetical protein
MTEEDAKKELESSRINTAMLDFLVHDAKAHEASTVNNNGKHGQIEYLHDEFGMPYADILETIKG